MATVLVVGAGISGATVARKLAEAGFKVRVIDKRDHVAGNCYDRIDVETGIRYNEYGAHIFHTNDEGVWEFVNRFALWNRYDHKVIAKVDHYWGREVPIPVNINTVNALFGENISSPEEMEAWLEKSRVVIPEIKTSEDFCLSTVGRQLTEKLFAPYTRKQWNKSLSELDASVLQRVSVRPNFDDRYFTDKYQALPARGYEDFVLQLLDHPDIEVHLFTDFRVAGVHPRDLHGHFDLCVYTGPIDEYFKYCGLPKLEYRSLEFTMHRFPTRGYFQKNSVVNHPNPDDPTIRSVEYKWFNNQASSHTLVVTERSTDRGEPYYPVPTQQNRDLYEKYKDLARREENVVFVGRLATYKYYNMDQAIRAALDSSDEIIARMTLQAPTLDRSNGAAASNI